MNKLLVIVFVAIAVVSAESDYEKLFNHLMNDYNKNVPPNENVEDKTEVQFSFTPICFDLGPDGILNGRVWYRMKYTDNRLAFDPADFGGLKLMRINPSRLWIPDIVLYNRDNDNNGAMFTDMSRSSNAIVYSTGMVLWVPDEYMRARCGGTHTSMDGLDLDDVWADQMCTLKYGSWTYDGNTMPLSLYDPEEFDIKQYAQNCPTKIVDVKQATVTKYYDCCPGEPYQHNEYNITLRRSWIFSGESIIRNPREGIENEVK